jgi:hypothetical protein
LRFLRRRSGLETISSTAKMPWYDLCPDVPHGQCWLHEFSAILVGRCIHFVREHCPGTQPIHHGHNVAIVVLEHQFHHRSEIWLPANVLFEPNLWPSIASCHHWLLI